MYKGYFTRLYTVTSNSLSIHAICIEFVQAYNQCSPESDMYTGGRSCVSDLNDGYCSGAKQRSI